MEFNEARTMCREEMNRWGLDAWALTWSRRALRFGCCFHYQKKIEMSMSLVMLNGREQCHDVILHEIAHALVGAGHGHDETWKAMCIRIGARPIRCWDKANPVAVAVPKTWEMYCPVCQVVLKQYHNCVNVEGKYHIRCSTSTAKAYVKIRPIKR